MYIVEKLFCPRPPLYLCLPTHPPNPTDSLDFIMIIPVHSQCYLQIPTNSVHNQSYKLSHSYKLDQTDHHLSFQTYLSCNKLEISVIRPFREILVSSYTILNFMTSRKTFLWGKYLIRF